MTIELDLKSGMGQVRYAREVVGQCKLNAAAFMDGRETAMTLIADSAVDSGAFFAQLTGAYHFAVRAIGAEPGDRIDLVELLAQGGLRVHLGTATGGSTRNKRDVFYVQTAPLEGQYRLLLQVVTVVSWSPGTSLSMFFNASGKAVSRPTRGS